MPKQIRGVIASKVSHTHTIFNAPTSPNVTRERKVKMEHSKQLGLEDIRILAVADPELVKNIYINNVGVETDHITILTIWLRRNCSKRFWIDEVDYGPNRIGFESEDDLVLFRTRFEGAKDDGRLDP